MKGQRFDEGFASFFSQSHHCDGFLLILLTEGIFERRPAVTDVGYFHLLRAVDMAQSHIVKIFYEGNVHAVQAAYIQGNLLGI